MTQPTSNDGLTRRRVDRQPINAGDDRSHSNDSDREFHGGFRVSVERESGRKDDIKSRSQAAH